MPVPLASFLVAVIGHLPAVGTWWSGGDWDLLARATGLTPVGPAPARLLGSLLYWRVLAPLCGVDPVPWAVGRLLLHGASAALLARLAARRGCAPGMALAAGLALAATPAVLAPLWSAGLTHDLLALCLALLAADRWLAARGFRPDGARDPAPARARRDFGAAALLGGLALLALAPLALARPIVPGLAYLATAVVALALAPLAPRRLAWRPIALLALAAAALAFSLGTWTIWLRVRGPDGRPRDPLLARTEISRAAARTLRAVPRRPVSGEDAPGFVLLQVPPTPAAVAQAGRSDERSVLESPLHTAVGGDLGPRLMLGVDVPVAWANRLDAPPPGALVLVEAGTRWLAWGGLEQARIYLALTYVARGCFFEAARTLLLNARASGPSIAFLFDADSLLEPPAVLLAREEAFDRYLAGPPGSGAGLAPALQPAMRQMWRDLMAAVRSDLRANARP